MYNIPHGILCGTLMASSNKITVRELRKDTGALSALRKYAGLGRLFLEEEEKSDDYYIDGFIDYLHRLTKEFELPLLRRFGLEEKEIEKVCRITENKNNPVNLSMEDLMEIISFRL